MIRVALNTTPLLSPFTGVGQYTYQLVKNLQNLADLELELFYGMSWNKQLRTKPIPGFVTAKKRIKQIIPSVYFLNRALQQYCFSRGAKTKQIQIYHEPNFLAFRCKQPSVITVHDLSWIRYPETHPRERVRAMERYFEPGLRRAAQIITVSEFVKQELINVFGIPAAQIHAIHNGVESLFQPQTEATTTATLAQHGLKHKNYLLTVGTLEPRKNLQATLQAYQQLPAALRKQYPLVIVGMKGWHTSDIEKQIAPLVRAGEVRQLGYLSREDLAMVTAGALTLIYPSIYEGFGLPPLEAMACGVPVITSHLSSLPEVVGDTGLLINPRDTDAITNAIQQLIADPTTRDTLAKAALIRSTKFTWEHCALQTVQLYKQAMGG